MRRWALLTLLLAGCGFSSVQDKSGGGAVPTTLTLLTNEGPGFLSRTQLEHFAAEARRRSGGVLRIRIIGPALDEHALADRVRGGRVALALVPSRAYDELRALQT